MAKVDLNPGSTTTVNVQRAEHVDSQYGGKQLKINGTFNGVAGGTHYCSAKLGELIMEAGAVTVLDNGDIRAVPTVTISIHREGSGTDTRWTVERTGGSPPASRSPSNAPASSSGSSGGEPAAVTFARLKTTLAACLKFSRENWPEATPPEVIASTAATLFIAAQQKNALAQPPKAPERPATDAQRHELDSLGERLAAHGWGTERLKEALIAIAKCDLASITENGAAAAIKHLAAKLAKAEEAARAKASDHDDGEAYAADESIPF